VARPELVARGFLHDDEREHEVLDKAAAALDKLLGTFGKDHLTGHRLVKEDIKETLSELVYRETRQRPMIMPVVVEV
jgi:ribonuclease J